MLFGRYKFGCHLLDTLTSSSYFSYARSHILEGQPCADAGRLERWSEHDGYAARNPTRRAKTSDP